MRTARFLAAIAAPLLIVACAVGTAPVDTGNGEGTDSGATADLDGNYGTTGDGSPTQTQDSGTTTGKDSGTAAKDGGTTVVDSGGGGGGTGEDCVGKTSSSGEKFESECQDLANESDCSLGGGECGTGTCCWDNPGSFSFGSCDGIFGDFGSAQCVPK